MSFQPYLDNIRAKTDKSPEEAATERFGAAGLRGNTDGVV